jgi:NAD(P)-dependent dehydrogenase (short-subunit alcohol dehydrogenase family)
VIVFAGARNPSPELEAIAAHHSDKVHIIKLTSGDEADNEAAVAEVQKVAGRLDVVIANAAIGMVTGPSLSTSSQAMAEHYAVNTIGPLVLFQATYPLLKASSSTPKFIPISSSGGSIEKRAGTPGLPYLAYGASKAALNYLARKLRADHEGLGTMLLHEQKIP